MTVYSSRRGLIAALGTVASTSSVGCLRKLSLSNKKSEREVLEEVGHLSKFSDVKIAIENGYRTTAKYVVTEEGTLGVPFINMDTEPLDQREPQLLYYDLSDTGRYEFLGVEWLVPADDRGRPPSLFGRRFHDAMTGEAPTIPRHYGLHVWTSESNPDGLFDLYNSSIEPPELLDTLRTARDQLGGYGFGGKALDAGYTNTEQCITTDGGGYGVPFIKTTSGGTDLAEPPILVYRLTPNWNYRLMGAEWFVPADEAGTSPDLMGQSFHEPMDGHDSEGNQPRHLGLHAWLFEANPEGMFSPFNSSVEC